ncbi:hypothetical protein [Streptosporangium amethystogenes]|uniref:hypothetical protein n=1 Tax=Streptosporangium amethystogenes TaxID=2002 RepID=UPI0012F8860C|nr:hypothetical protein [Streptosporangium amethystogenes]
MSIDEPETGMARPVRWPAGYALADAGPGEVVGITVDIPARAFRHWSAEEGAFTVLAGRSAADPPLSVEVLAGEQAPALRKPLGERSLAVL